MIARTLLLLTVAFAGAFGHRSSPFEAPVRPAAPVFDCNDNGIEDSVDIAFGTSADADENGIPDECCSGDAPETVSPEASGRLRVPLVAASGVLD